MSSNKESVSEFLWSFRVTFLLTELTLQGNRHKTAGEKQDNFLRYHNPFLGPRTCY